MPEYLEGRLTAATESAEPLRRIMHGPSYHQQLAREHELTRRHILQTRNELDLLRRGELFHPLTRRKYRRLLRATLDELEETLEQIECEWYG